MQVKEIHCGAKSYIRRIDNYTDVDLIEDKKYDKRFE